MEMFSKILIKRGRARLFTPVIAVSWEADIRSIIDAGWLRKKKS
jgi:hypothetical protein